MQNLVSKFQWTFVQPLPTPSYHIERQTPLTPAITLGGFPPIRPVHKFKSFITNSNFDNFHKHSQKNHLMQYGSSFRSADNDLSKKMGQKIGKLFPKLKYQTLEIFVLDFIFQLQSLKFQTFGAFQLNTKPVFQLHNQTNLMCNIQVFTNSPSFLSLIAMHLLSLSMQTGK